MKKTMIIILLILPIFLMISINIAGKIVSSLVHIPVEKIELVDENNKSYNQITIKPGTSVDLTVIIYPELATNQRYTITSDDPEKLSVLKKTITAHDYGIVKVIIKSEENSEIATTLTVNIYDSSVSAVSFDKELIEINLKQITYPYLYTESLKYQVTPYTATNKKVIFTSSNPEVITVSSDGKLTVLKYSNEEIIITITAVDGGFTDTLVVILNQDETPVLAFNDYGGTINYNNPIKLNPNNYPDEKIDLSYYIVFDETKISLADLKFTITEGLNYASFNNNDHILTITDPTYTGIIKITISYEEYQLILLLVYKH